MLAQTGLKQFVLARTCLNTSVLAETRLNEMCVRSNMSQQICVSSNSSQQMCDMCVSSSMSQQNCCSSNMFQQMCVSSHVSQHNVYLHSYCIRIRICNYICMCIMSPPVSHLWNLYPPDHPHGEFCTRGKTCQTRMCNLVLLGTKSVPINLC